MTVSTTSIVLCLFKFPGFAILIFLFLSFELLKGLDSNVLCLTPRVNWIFINFLIS